MAFGAQKDATNRTLTASTSHTANIPTSVSGWGVFVWVGIPSTTDIINTPSGWTKVGTWAGATTRVSLFAINGINLSGATTQAFTSSSSTVAVLETWAVELADIVPDEIVWDSGTGEAWGPGPFLSAAFGVEYVSNCFGMYTYSEPDYPLMASSDFDSDYTAIRRNPKLDADDASGAHSATNLTTSSKPESVMGMSGTGTTTFEWVSVGFAVIEGTTPPLSLDISTTTLATVAGEATERKKVDVTATTSAAISVLGEGISPPNPPDGLPEVVTSIRATTLAFAQSVTNEPTGIDIAVTTSAEVLVRASPVDSLKHFATGTVVTAAATARPVHRIAEMSALTEAGAEVANQLPLANALCCCITPEFPCTSTVSFVTSGYPPTWSLGTQSPNPYVPILARVFVAEPGRFSLYKDDGSGIEVLLDSVRSEQMAADGWSVSGKDSTKFYNIVPGVTIRGEYLGDSGCKIEETCEVYGWPAIEPCDTYWFSEGIFDGDKCWPLPTVVALYAAAPTVSIQVSGLIGPLAALNGVYSIKAAVEEDPEVCPSVITAKVCWIPEIGGFHYAEGSVTVQASGFQAGSAAVTIRTNHRYWTFGPPPDIECESFLPRADAEATRQIQIVRPFDTVVDAYATEFASCSIECELEPQVQFSRSTGKVFRGYLPEQTTVTGSCRYDRFGLDLWADHCADSAVVTWL